MNFTLSDDEDDATIISDIENIANLNELEDEEEGLEEDEGQDDDDEPMDTEDSSCVFQELQSDQSELESTKAADQESLPKDFREVNFATALVAEPAGSEQENSQDIVELVEEDAIPDTIDDNIG